ncbi:hypothetical protein J6590_065349 [Homalodisca vitripennis]|nr:hypothetical protein J6590_065349 [Homalodisca vitripennis]
MMTERHDACSGAPRRLSTVCQLLSDSTRRSVTTPDTYTSSRRMRAERGNESNLHRIQSRDYQEKDKVYGEL